MKPKLINSIAVGIAATIGRADLACFVKDEGTLLMHIYDNYFEGSKDWEKAKAVAKLIVDSKGFGFTERDSIDWIF